MSSTTPRTSPDIESRIRVDQNDRQVVVAVEDTGTSSTSLVAAVDPFVDAELLAALVDELNRELARIHPDAAELVGDALLEGSA